MRDSRTLRSGIGCRAIHAIGIAVAMLCSNTGCSRENASTRPLPSPGTQIRVGAGFRCVPFEGLQNDDPIIYRVADARNRIDPRLPKSDYGILRKLEKYMDKSRLYFVSLDHRTVFIY